MVRKLACINKGSEEENCELVNTDVNNFCLLIRKLHRARSLIKQTGPSAASISVKKKDASALGVILENKHIFKYKDFTFSQDIMRCYCIAAFGLSG